MIAIIFLILATSFVSYSQNYLIKTDSLKNKPMLVGECSRKVLSDSAFSEWFNTEYDNYTPDTNYIEGLKSKISGKSISIIMGTWCSDSRREVPRFIRILDTIGFPESCLKMYALDRKKKSNSAYTDSLDIQFVPTIIIYDTGVEIGRIIETPVRSLESDLYDILN